MAHVTTTEYNCTTPTYESRQYLIFLKRLLADFALMNRWLVNEYIYTKAYIPQQWFHAIYSQQCLNFEFGMFVSWVYTAKSSLKFHKRAFNRFSEKPQLWVVSWEKRQWGLAIVLLMLTLYDNYH